MDDHGLLASIASERIVLGSIIKDVSVLGRAFAAGLDDDLFTVGEHRLLFETKVAQHDSEGVVSSQSLTAGLTESGMLHLAGGAPYIGELEQYGVPWDQMRPRIAALGELTARRELVGLAEDLIHKARDQAQPLPSTLDWWERSLCNIGRRLAVSPPKPIADVLNRLKGGATTSGESSLGLLPSGVDDLDRLIGGFRPGEIALLIADSYSASLTLGLALVQGMGAAGKSGLLVFTAPLSAVEFTYRLARWCAGSDSEGAEPEPVTWPGGGRGDAALAKLRPAPVYIDDGDYRTATRVRWSLSMGAVRWNIRAAIFLCPGGSANPVIAEERSGPGSMVPHLRNLAKTLNIAIIQISHIGHLAKEGRTDEDDHLDRRREAASTSVADLILLVEGIRPRAQGTSGESPRVTIWRHRAGLVGSATVNLPGEPSAPGGPTHG